MTLSHMEEENKRKEVEEEMKIKDENGNAEILQY